MTLNNLAGKPLKHFAQNNKTNARYVMLCYANDTDPNTCSVVDIDKLDPDMRAELDNLIRSEECQMVLDTWKVLDKKFFMSYPKATVLKVLQSIRKIEVVKSEDVSVSCLQNQVRTPKQIVDEIKAYEASKGKKTFNPTGIETLNVTDVEPVKTEPAPVANNSELQEIKDQLSSLTSAITTLVGVLQPKEEKKSKK